MGFWSFDESLKPNGVVSLVSPFLLSPSLVGFESARLLDHPVYSFSFLSFLQWSHGWLFEALRWSHTSGWRRCWGSEWRWLGTAGGSARPDGAASLRASFLSASVGLDVCTCRTLHMFRTCFKSTRRIWKSNVALCRGRIHLFPASFSFTGRKICFIKYFSPP